MDDDTTSRGAVVGVRELKNRLSAHLDRVKSGEEIVVTEHGRPIARLSPVGTDVDRMTALVDAGIVRPPVDTARRLPETRIRLSGTGSLDESCTGSLDESCTGSLDKSCTGSLDKSCTGSLDEEIAAQRQ